LDQEAIKAFKECFLTLKSIHDRTSKGVDVTKDDLLFNTGVALGCVERGLTILNALSPEEVTKLTSITVEEVGTIPRKGMS